jgi:hypothetical protein
VVLKATFLRAGAILACTRSIGAGLKLTLTEFGSIGPRIAGHLPSGALGVI